MSNFKNILEQVVRKNSHYMAESEEEAKGKKAADETDEDKDEVTEKSKAKKAALKESVSGPVDNRDAQSYLKVVFAINDYANCPVLLGYKILRNGAFLFLWKDEDEGLYCVSEVRKGDVSPMPMDEFIDYREAKEAMRRY